MRYSPRSLFMLLSTCLVLSPAYAQDTVQEAQVSQAGPTSVAPVGQWNYDEIYRTGGFRADTLLDIAVYNPDGEEIGTVENAILDRDNRIMALIAQVGGLWDIGDTHVAVPWNEVELTDNGVVVPIREENVDDYGLFDESYLIQQDLDQPTQVEDDLYTGPQTWKLSDLLNDFANIDDGEGYGYVTDVLFSEQGKLQALVIDPSQEKYGAGPYAYPFYGYERGWQPGLPSYEISLPSEDASQLPAFDYDRYTTRWQ